MARRDGICGPLHFFDIQNLLDAISLPGIRKWPGPGFTFFTLVCLDTNPSLDAFGQLGSPLSFRRILYCFSGSSGSGFEAFVTPSHHL
ncbi:unnamed protein product, partial [Lymnaea stagnalis]